MDPRAERFDCVDRVGDGLSVVGECTRAAVLWYCWVVEEVVCRSFALAWIWAVSFLVTVSGEPLGVQSVHSWW